MKKIFLGMTLGMVLFANTANANNIMQSFTYINFALEQFARQKIIPEMQKTCSFQSRSACKN